MLCDMAVASPLCSVCTALIDPGIAGLRTSRARDTGHLSQPIIREILSLTLFNRLQNKTCHEFRGIALAIIGRRSASRRTPHPVFAKVRRRDERDKLR